MTEDYVDRVESILLFISDYVRREGGAPTIREIGEHENLLSTSTVVYWLKTLEADGLIERKAHRPKSIKITPEGLKRVGLTRITVR